MNDAFEVIDRNAEESGNKHAFMCGMVFGLGLADALIRDSQTPQESIAKIIVLLEMINDHHFKDLEQ